jgi:hypothetical protein
MILNNAPQDQAVLSNVGEVGGFKIKASAKAFNILSSGLYANKIRAIIRELSCNAVDSHVAAGKTETPFDVHLPNSLEPWFAIRDYGTGLSHDQVTNIYTTYFESTKTASNEFIGALGLGSKSPFSYTDNFTVTAIQDGKKGIYTAFINGDGVPSIALMMTEDTDEPSGVEVKFSVNETYDFSKFRDEARQVYTYFKLKPVVSGYKDFTFNLVDYESQNIVPGVHAQRGGHNSKAIMGNIAYPIDVPNADKVLGDLRGLLGCALEMHFGIGELDFQASREGLSYIPSTIDAIKAKLEAVNAALTVVLAKEADDISNPWERALFLKNKRDSALWSAAVIKYVTDNATPLINLGNDRWDFFIKNSVSVEDLNKKYNIAVTAFSHSGNSTTATNCKSEYDYVKQADGNSVSVHKWRFHIDRGTRFVVNDLKVGATERSKFHWKNTPKEKTEAHNQTVFVLSREDKTKPMDTKAFFEAIHNPPSQWIVNASSLKEKTRVSGSLKNVSILELQERGSGGYYRAKEMVWRDAGKADSFDTNTTHYYLPLSGFSPISKVGATFDVKRFYSDLKDCGVSTLKVHVYGVRKSDLEFIQSQKNWINIEDHIASELSKLDNKLTMSMVLNTVDNFNLLQYNSNIVYNVESADSPYVKLVKQFMGFEKIRYSEQSLKNLCHLYAKTVTFDPQTTVDKFEAECKKVSNHYPLLQYLRSAPSEEVSAYINLIDTQKGVK